MKSILKFVAITVGLVLIGIAAAAILLAFHLDSLGDAALERTLGYIYGTDVTVERLEFHPGDAAFDVHGLTVYNPEPFRKGPAMEFGRIRVAFDPATLLDGPPVVKEVVLHDARIHLRYEVGEGTNLSCLDRNAARLLGQKKEASPAGARGSFVVQSFRSEAARLDVSANLAPVASLGMDIAPFTMSDLSREAPISTIDMCVLFVRSILREAVTVKGLVGPLADRHHADDRSGAARSGARKT